MIDTLKNLYRKFNKNYQAEFLLKKELAYFRECKRILDIGCGEGGFIALDPKRIIGVDQNKNSIAVCKSKKFAAVYGKATKLPFADSTFDGVHCSHVIEHLFPADAFLMLKEVSRVLKKRGIFLLSSPILWYGFYNDFSHIKPYNPESIERYLCGGGYQKTFPDLHIQFLRIALEWRFRPLPLPGKIGYLLANYFYRYGLHSWQKDAYTLVFKKVT